MTYILIPSAKAEMFFNGRFGGFGKEFIQGLVLVWLRARALRATKTGRDAPAPTVEFCKCQQVFLSI